MRNIFLAVVSCFAGISFLTNSCTFSSNANMSLGGDTVIENQIEEPILDSSQSVLLWDLLDSVRRDLIYFPPIDSTNSVDPRIAKKQFRDSIYRELRKKPKHIYLTFDDGPLIGSASIDSIISSRDIDVSVFLIGRHAKMSKHLTKSMQRYKDNPHVGVYNHSYTHGSNRYSAFYRDPTNAFADFMKAQNEMELTEKIARLPGRNIWMFDSISRADGSSGKSTAQMLHNEGFKIFGWDVEWRINSVTGVSDQTPQQVFSKIKSYMSNYYSYYPNNVVLLMHDDMFQTKKGQKMLSELIDSLKTLDDYHFEKLENFPKKY